MMKMATRCLDTKSVAFSDPDPPKKQKDTTYIHTSNHKRYYRCILKENQIHLKSSHFIHRKQGVSSCVLV